jgi:signal-transduction protein with cAMP-binding, CBS, and nucleotidyltransferase domain
MNARDLMTKKLAWIAPDATVAEAAATLSAASEGVVCLLVGAPGAPPEGIVTGVDILRGALQTAFQHGRLPCAPDAIVTAQDLARPGMLADMACAARRTPVRQIMSSPVRCVDRDDNASELMDLLIRRKIESVPVLHGGRVVGVVHRRALVRVLGELMCAET